jgi:hypothetical protein
MAVPNPAKLGGCAAVHLAFPSREADPKAPPTLDQPPSLHLAKFFYLEFESRSLSEKGIPTFSSLLYLESAGALGRL